ncbi:MAG: 50S ribosomal protein L30e [Methanosarcinales archaeon]|nr:50S ribosomal protein L30e [Methanosarcinales archaeon]
MDFDLNTEIRKTVKTGQVTIGSKETVKAITAKTAKAVIMAQNCPAAIRKTIIDSDVNVIEFPGQGVELGILCRKPFLVASAAIIEPGESNILSTFEVE